MPFWLILSSIAALIAPGYSPIESHVSVNSLAQGWPLWLTNSAGLISGAGLLAFGAGVWAASRRVFAGGALCWIIFGVAMVANGIWPMGSPMHGLYVIGIFNILAPALTVLECREEGLRQDMIPITVFCSLMGMLYLWLNLVGLDPEGYRGLTQRVFGSINFLWPMVFAYRALKKDEMLVRV